MIAFSHPPDLASGSLVADREPNSCREAGHPDTIAVRVADDDRGDS